MLLGNARGAGPSHAHVLANHLRSRSHGKTSDLLPIVVFHVDGQRYFAASQNIFDFLTGARRAEEESQAIVGVADRIGLRIAVLAQRCQRQITSCFDDLQYELSQLRIHRCVSLPREAGCVSSMVVASLRTGYLRLTYVKSVSIRYQQRRTTAGASMYHNVI